MLLQASDSTLLIVDMQGRLMPVIHDGDAVVAANAKLARAARLLDVPVVATEHHSKMLGVTVALLAELVQSTFQKMHFSAAREHGFDARCRRRENGAGDRLRSPHLRVADRHRFDRAGLQGGAGGRCGRFAQIVRPPCRVAPRARPRRRDRHHGNGHFRVDGDLRAPALPRRVTSGQIAGHACNIVPGSRKDSLAL